MPSTKKIIERDHKIMSSSYHRAENFSIQKLKGNYIWDAEGKKYLDFAAGIAVANAGHTNSEVVAAIKKQLKSGLHAAFPDFYSEVPVKFSETLLSCMPGNYNSVFLSNSGTESIEAAIKCAHWHTKKKWLIAFHGCFHGRTMGSLSMTHHENVKGWRMGPFLPVRHVPYPNKYRSDFDSEAEETEFCLSALETVMKDLGTEGVAAVFIESIQGEGGYIVPTEGFIPGVRELCTKYDILMCDDEVQAGAYRTGKFLGIEHWKTEPDIISMSKAIGGGLPLGATVSTKKIMNWAPNSHSNTFGGNLLACAAGTAALEFMKKKKCGKNAEEIGNHIMKKLNQGMKNTTMVGDVRGKGLMIGIEIVKDKESKAVAEKERDQVIELCRKRGLNLLGAGESVIRLCPPLTINKREADAAVKTILKSIQDIESQ